MDPEEIRDHLKPTAQKLKQNALDSGSWYSYQNELCTSPNMFIHEFKGGRKELVQLDDKTSEYKILRIL